jgi:sRNA-binding protein
MQLDDLVRIYPIFRRDPPVFLAPEVRAALVDRHRGAYSSTSIARALAKYKSTEEYRAVALEGAPMHDLEGNVVGFATADQASRAAVPQRKKKRPPPPALEMLAQRFPNLFNLQDPRPLPRGTYKELLKLLGKQYTPAVIAQALHHFCTTDQYREAVRRRSPPQSTSSTDTSRGTPGANIDPGQKERLTLEILAGRYPACFGTAALRPLAASVRIEVHAALHAEFSKTSIDTAIRAHRLQDQYLQLLVTGAPRFNLNGQMEGTVSDDEARRARDLLIDPVRKAGWLRRIRDGKSLNPWGRHELLASMEAKGLTPDEFALRYDLPPLGVIAHHNLAEKEQRLELEAQRRIVAEYRASGLIVKQFAESKWIRPRVLSKAVSAVAAADIEKALAATVEAQKHAALDLHSNVEPDPTAQQARHSSAPTVSVRRRRRIDPVDAVTLLARPQRSAPDRT